MESLPNINFKNLKPNIAAAIKESCYQLDARLYNIANQVLEIRTYSVDLEVEGVQGLSKIIDKIIKESVALGCNLSVVVKGISTGAFRSSPSTLPEAKKTISILIKEILHSILKYKGDAKQAIEGILAASIIISKDFKLNEKEVLTVVKEDILSSANTLDPKFADEIKKAFPQLDEL